jgi:hypothetical protein
MTEFIRESGSDFPMMHRYDKMLFHVGDMIAGGFAKNAVLGNRPRDLDMYFTSVNDLEDTRQRLMADGWEERYRSAHAIGVTDGHTSVDLVKMGYGSAERILSTFDFTICKFAWVRVAEDAEQEPDAGQADENEGGAGDYPCSAVFASTFFEHLAMKRLVIDDRLPLPLSTFQRMFKYTRYGFNLCRASKVKLLAAITNTIIELPGESGIDEALSNILYEGID